jgi:Family of unknown function (DUF6498)
MDEIRHGSYKRAVNPAKLITRFRDIDWLQPSVIAIIVANLTPLVALFVFHWDVFSLLFLFWLENVIIGVFNVLKMLLAGVGARDLPPFGWVAFTALKCFLIPFFCFHYGLFTFVHGMFIIGFFGKSALHQFGLLNLQLIIQIIHENHLEWSFASLVAGHLISFVWDYLWSGEFRRSNPMELMVQPYRRVVVMHLTVLLGGILAMALKLPEAALVLLVVLKVAADLWGHQNVREKVAAKSAVSTGSVTKGSTPSIQTALQSALQARAAQSGRPAGKIPVPLIAGLLVFASFAVVFFGLSGYVFYDAIRPFVRRPIPATASVATKAGPDWTLTADHAWIPEMPAAGRFKGNPFHANRGVLAGEVLRLSDTSGDTSRTFAIRFTPEQMNAMANRIFQIGTNDAANVPEVRLVTHPKNSKDDDIETFAGGYAMQWQFGVTNKNKVALKIYLCLPDAQRSFVAGAFKITINKDKTAAGPVEN